MLFVGDSKEAAGDEESIAIGTTHNNRNNEDQNEGVGISRTNSDKTNVDGNTTDVMKDPNHSSHGDDLGNHGNGTGDGSGDYDIGSSRHDGKIDQYENGELEKEKTSEGMNGDDASRGGGGGDASDACRGQDEGSRAAFNDGKDVDGGEQVSTA